MVANKPDVSALVEALAQIERWDGFPSTDKMWEGSREPVSYGAAFGSNGERDFMREVARKALVAHRKHQEGEAGKMSKYKVVPISPSRSIEDAIGRARNLSASEIWEDALAAVSETDMIAITATEYVSISAMANRVAELENVLRKASAHIRPTCFELYDELIKILEKQKDDV